MTPRRPRGRRPDQPLVDLASVFADDELLDSLAAGHGSAGLGAVGADDPLPELFQSWRTEMTARPLPAPPSGRAAAAALSAVVTPKPARALRPVLAASVAIVALLLGSAVLFTRTATENSPLWGIASVIWQDRAQSVDSRNEAKAKLTEAKAALEAGSPEVAELKLQEAEAALNQVSDVDNPDDVKALWETVKSQSEDSQQASAASSSAESVRSAASSSRSSAPASTPSSTRGSAPPIVQVPSEAVAPFVPDPEVPAATQAPTTPARVAPPVVADPFLSIVDPTSSVEVVTPPLLPPPPVVTTPPIEPALPVEPTPVPPVEVTPEVSTTPIVPPEVTPPVEATADPPTSTTPTTPTTTDTATTTTPVPDPGEIPGAVIDGQQESVTTAVTETTTAG